MKNSERRSPKRQAPKSTPTYTAPPVAELPAGPVVFAAGAAITARTLALYLSTAARSIIVGDTAELAMVAATFGVAHPPGYPLLTLLGHLFTFLPLQPVAFRMNLLAVICGTATVALIYAAS